MSDFEQFSTLLAEHLKVDSAVTEDEFWPSFVGTCAILRSEYKDTFFDRINLHTWEFYRIGCVDGAAVLCGMGVVEDPHISVANMYKKLNGG